MNGVERVGMRIGISQTTKVYDSSPLKKPSMIIYKEKNFTNGLFTSTFFAKDTEAMVSVIFKYSKQVNSTGQESERFYSFDLVNSRTIPQFVLRKFNDGVVKQISAVNASIKGLSALGYVEEKKTVVMVQCVNEKITIKVSINDSEVTNVISAEDESIKSGSVGVGTFKTAAEFTNLEIMPPHLDLTEADKNYILQNDIDYIPIPDVRAIKQASSHSAHKMSAYSADAIASVNLLATSLGSTLGKDWSHTSSTSVASGSSSSSMTIAEQSNGWGECLLKRTPGERTNYCNALSSGIDRINCKVSF
jgi:hypothetical protein